MPQVHHKAGARSAEPKDLAVRRNFLQQLWFGTTAMQMEHRVAETLAGNIFVLYILSTRMAEDGVLGGVCSCSSHNEDDDD